MLPQLLSEREAAKLLGCSTDTLSRERKRNHIGFIRIGGRVAYTEEQLAEYIKNGTVEPRTEKP